MSMSLNDLVVVLLFVVYFVVLLAVADFGGEIVLKGIWPNVVLDDFAKLVRTCRDEIKQTGINDGVFSLLFPEKTEAGWSIEWSL